MDTDYRKQKRLRGIKKRLQRLLGDMERVIGARKLRFYTLLGKAKHCFGCDNISGRGRVGGAAPSSENLGPLSYIGNY